MSTPEDLSGPGTSPADDPQVAANTCPDCGGTGTADGASCATCGGTGQVEELVGDA